MCGHDFPDFDYLKDIFMAEIKTDSSGFPNLSLRTIVSALAVAILVAWGLHAVFIAGPAMRAAAHESVERSIADEDRQFCEKFGIRSGSDAFAACGRELSIVRQKQADRDSAAAQGVL
jgi:predicted hydrocarbon binding protein